MHPLIVCKSHYTFLEGVHSPSELVDFAKKEGVEALCLADKNGLYGAVEFMVLCREADIQPLIATELTQDRRSATIVARNRKGYEELCELVTRRQLDGLEIADDEALHSPNFVILCGDPFLLQRWLRKRKELRGDNLFVALNMGDRKSVRSTVNLLSRRFDLPPIPAVPVVEWNILTRSDESLYDTLRAIDLNCTVETLPEERERYVERRMNPEEISYEPVISGEEIAELCNVEFDLEHYHLPRFLKST